MVDAWEVLVTGLSVEEKSGNSILLTEVDADLGFPVVSASLPNTATPQEFKIGFSHGRLSISPSRAATSITVSLELLLSSDGSLEVSVVPGISSLMLQSAGELFTISARLAQCTPLTRSFKSVSKTSGSLYFSVLNTLYKNISWPCCCYSAVCWQSSSTLIW